MCRSSMLLALLDNDYSEIPYQDHVRGYGDGGFGDSWSNWFAILKEGSLLYNDQLVGTSMDNNTRAMDRWTSHLHYPHDR